MWATDPNSGKRRGVFLNQAPLACSAKRPCPTIHNREPPTGSRHEAPRHARGYPESLKPTDYLSFYADQFDTGELDAMFDSMNSI
jgi:hypothetical protein